MNSCLGPNFGRMFQSFAPSILKLRSPRHQSEIVGGFQWSRDANGRGTYCTWRTNKEKTVDKIPLKKTNSFLTFTNEMVSFHHGTCGFFSFDPIGSTDLWRWTTRWTLTEIQATRSCHRHLWAEQTQVKKTRRSKPAAGTKRCQSSWRRKFAGNLFLGSPKKGGFGENLSGIFLPSKRWSCGQVQADSRFVWRCLEPNKWISFDPRTDVLWEPKQLQKKNVEFLKFLSIFETTFHIHTFWPLDSWGHGVWEICWNGKC